MLLKDILSRDTPGNLEDISNRNKDYFAQMVETMNNQEEILPQTFYHTWVKKNLDQIEKSLLKDYSIKMVCGNKTKNLLLTSFQSFKVLEYLKMKYDKTVIFNPSTLLEYDANLYYSLANISVAMLINKYKPESLYLEHIIFICIKVMLTYFTLYDKTGFLVNLSHVAVCSTWLLDTEIEQYDQLAKSLGFNVIQYGELKKINKLLSKEQLDAIIIPGDSQTIIKNKIMKACPCGERKARYIMKEFGLTNQKFTRKDYLKLDDEI